MKTAKKPQLPEHLAIESKRCAGCQKECHANKIGTEFDTIMAPMRKGDVHTAKTNLMAHDPLPHITSHLCYEGVTCPKGIDIRGVMRDIATHGEHKEAKTRKNVPAVAIIGSGISGLTLAHLAKSKGYEVHLFEAMPEIGGSMRYLIPEHRLPRGSVIDQLKDAAQGIEVYTNAVIGSTVFVEELAREFDAVIVATGANKPAFPGIPGESYLGVYTANDVLFGVDHGQPSVSVVVGNTEAALDASIIMAKQGNMVTLVTTKDSTEISPDHRLVNHAKRAGVQFMVLTEPMSIIGDDKFQAKGIQLRHLMLGDEDYDGKRLVMPIEDSEFVMDCNKIVLATGYDPNPSIGMYSTLRTLGKNKIWTNKNSQTTIENVFASGEMVLGKTNPENVIRNAKEVFSKVELYLKGELPKDELSDDE